MEGEIRVGGVTSKMSEVSVIEFRNTMYRRMHRPPLCFFLSGSSATSDPVLLLKINEFARARVGTFLSV